MSAPAALIALQHRSFRWYWLNTITFFLAFNAIRYVAGWVVLDGLDESESVQGLVIFLNGLPALLLLMPAGVLADRMSPLKFLMSTQVFTIVALVGTALALGDGPGTLAIVIAAVIMLGIGTAMGAPVRQALIPRYLKGDALYNGIALNAVAITASVVVGPLIAQAVGNRFGFAGPFWYLAILMAIGLFCVSRMDQPDPVESPTGPAESESILASVAGAFRFIRSEPAIRVLFLLLSMGGFLMTPAMFVTMQAHLKEEMGRSAADAAPVLAMMGLGMLVSSVFVMTRPGMKRKGVIFIRAFCGACSIVLLVGLNTNWYLLLGLALCMGLFGGFYINMNQGLIQSNTPNEIMGRVMGVYALVNIGLSPIGALLIGLLAGSIGTGAAMATAGAIALMSGLAAALFARELHTME